MLSSALLLATLAVGPNPYPVSDTTGAMSPTLVGVGIEERLGEKVDGSLAFTDETGKSVRLGDYLAHGRPVLLNFAYFHCPMLCGLVQNGMVNGLKPLDWTPGRQYEILTVGMDWREGPAEALPVKNRLVPELGKAGSEKGWHFLTGNYKAVHALARSVGFNYNYVPDRNDFAHAAGLIFISPEGKISRYLYGIEFSPRDMRLALLDASEGKSLSLGDKLAMFCYSYDAHTQGYVLFARNFMKAGGLAVLGLLLLLLIPLWRREVRNRRLSGLSTGKDA
ncbi:MAG: electron transporter SenC [Fibrobacteria bacterium]|nr:electron transporter SenC [Fibrobacteria bacterium]